MAKSSKRKAPPKWGDVDLAIPLQGPPVGARPLIVFGPALVALLRLEAGGYAPELVAGTVAVTREPKPLSREQQGFLSTYKTQLRAIVQYVNDMPDLGR